MLTPDDLAHHSGFVRRLAGALVRDPALADDIAQDAMLVAIERPPADTRNPRGWLRRVVASVASNRARTEARRRRRERAAAREEEVPADDGAARLETQRRLVDAVLSLEEPYRSTVVLRFLDGLTVNEVARRQGVPAKTTETRLRRALEKLRARLDRGGKASGAVLLPLAGIDGKAAVPAAGVLAMASKATFAIAGFVCGIGATVLYTEVATPERPERAAPREHREAAVPASAEPTAVPDATPGTPEKPKASPTEYLRRINEAADVQGAWLVACEIAALPPEEGRDVMLAIFREIADGEKRRKALAAFVWAPHPFVLDVLDLGATDPDPAVRATAFEHLRPFTLRAFQEAPDAYPRWRAQHAGQPLSDVLRASARDLAERWRTLDRAALEKELRVIGGPPQRPSPAEALREAGIPAIVEGWLANPMPDEQADPEGYRLEREIRAAGWRWLDASEPGEAYVRRVIVPLLEDPRRPAEEVLFAVGVIGKTKSPWAFEAVLGYLKRMDLSNSLTFDVGQALGESGDKRAIPWLIGAIVANDTYSTVYGLGYFGLGPQTGVSYDESHDAAWWLRWWDENKGGLPADVRALDPRALASGFRR